jgi:glutamate synthase (NADPH/NADH)
LQRSAADLGLAKLPPKGEYGVGMFFLPTNDERRAKVKSIFEKVRNFVV